QTFPSGYGWRAIESTIVWFQHRPDAPGRVHWVDDDGQRSATTPRGARAVGFASATHLLAVGKTADLVWTTTDAGETWQSQPLAVHGDPASVHIAPGPPGLLQCSRFACAAPPVLWAHPDLIDGLRYESPTIVAPYRSQD
ncbi:MAG: hypothetical protein JKY37_06905, partial [Nannocystaceae bacterium]|nr:hypothetical protein [Nannocystaceae bacterium]